MAKFDNEEQVTSKQQAVDISRKKNIASTKAKPQIDKGKFIAFGAAGLIAIIVIGFIGYSASTEKNDEASTEIVTPESESEKYNTKLQAMENEDKENNDRKVDLTQTFAKEKSEKEIQTEEEKNLENQIKQLEREQYEKPITSNSSPKKTSGGTRRINSKPAPPRYENSNTEEKESAPIQKVTTSPVTQKKSKSSFFKKRTTPATSNKVNNDILLLACIHTNQLIMNNQRVKFRTTSELEYNNQIYPPNTIIYGLAEIRPNRLIIKINRINQTDVKLEVYDSEDSERGLYILTPNLNASLQKELKKETLNEDDIEKIPFSKSLKNIFEKKIKEEKVQLLNNYKVLIKIAENE